MNQIHPIHKKVLSFVCVISLLVFLFSLDKALAVTFTAKADYAVGSGPTSIATADFNGDGKLDIVTANGTSDNVSILLGDGSGGFTSATGSPFLVGSQPLGVVADDFNNDGSVDLAVANGMSSNVSILLGDGSGGFTEAVGSPFAVADGPSAIVAGYFDNNGNLDIATMNNYTNNVSVLLGDGLGGFSNSVGYGQATSRFGHIITADFDGNGKEDLATITYSFNRISILLGAGDGTFSASNIDTIPSLAFGIVAHDFNGDGKKDLAYTDSANKISILFGNGNGTFIPNVNCPYGPNINCPPVLGTLLSLTQGDFNGDGIADLATSGTNNKVSILTGNGDGTFNTPIFFNVGGTPLSIVAGDLNKDGLLDIVTANQSSNSISVLLGTAVPSQVTYFIATAVSDSQIDLNWEAPASNGNSAITGYKIERESPVGGGFSTIVANTGLVKTYTDNDLGLGLAPATQYNYRISAINAIGESRVSNEKDATTFPLSTVPGQATNLTATAISTTQIDLNWGTPASDGGSAILGYKIERESPVGGGFSTVVANTGVVNVFSDINLNSSTQYNYRVYVLNVIGSSIASNEANATTKTQTTGGGGGGGGGYICVPPNQMINGICTPPVIITPPVVPPETPPIVVVPPTVTPPVVIPTVPTIPTIVEPPIENPPIVVITTEPTTEPTIEVSQGNPEVTPLTSEIPAVENIPIPAPIQKTEIPASVKVATVFGLFIGLATLNIKDIALSGFKLWSLLMGFLGIKKRHRHWGVVYDSVTKQPLDPAYVTLLNDQGKQVGSCITDMDGRYGFLVNEGTYTIQVGKTDYLFPSEKLKGKENDELYPDLYFGEPIYISSHSEVVYKNIPMDPLKFNWNEFIKKHNEMTRFYSQKDYIIDRLATILFFGGAILSFLVLYLEPSIFNIVIVGIYILLFIFRHFNIKHKDKGRIIEKVTGRPLPFAIMRVFSKETNTEITHKVVDQYGNFFCLIANGQYYVRIDRKLDSGEYQTVYNSDVILVDRGLINIKFEV